MRLVAFTFSISLPGVPESWESRSLGSLGSPGVLGVSGVPESQTVNCTFAGGHLPIVKKSLISVLELYVLYIYVGDDDAFSIGVCDCGTVLVQYIRE